MEIGTLVGWLGVAFGLFVAPPQLYRIIKTKEVKGISLTTYIFLCLAMVCYLIHAVYIGSAVFVTSQAVNLAVNVAILALLIRRR